MNASFEEIIKMRNQVKSEEGDRRKMYKKTNRNRKYSFENGRRRSKSETERMIIPITEMHQIMIMRRTHIVI